MPAKIRLQRHGKKGFAFFHIVIADGRAPRDGRFIEKLGTYNPNTNPATIDLNFDRALHWLNNGAQPTDTAKAILSYKGVLFRNHLQKGVLKGAFNQEVADARFEKWVSEKDAKIASKVQKISGARQEDLRSRLAAEKATNEAKAKALVDKRMAAEASESAAPEETASEDAAQPAGE